MYEVYIGIYQRLKLQGTRKSRSIKGNYFVVSAHREENISSEKKLLHLCSILNDMAKTYKFLSSCLHIQELAI